MLLRKNWVSGDSERPDEETDRRGEERQAEGAFTNKRVVSRKDDLICHDSIAHLSV